VSDRPRADGRTRAENVAEATRLREEHGLTYREIAERMGAKLKTVYGWVTDPDLSRHYERRYRYGGKCEECGAPTDGSRGPAAPARLCKRCAQEPWWTRDRIITAIRRWHKLTGEAPSQTDWEPSHPGHRPSRALEQDHWPCVHTVQRVFGTWVAAVEAAGLEPRGRRDLHRYDDLEALIGRIRAGESARSISLGMGLSAYAVHQALYDRGLSVRAIRAGAAA
jgi:hypothetical protein